MPIATALMLMPLRPSTLNRRQAIPGRLLERYAHYSHTGQSIGKRSAVHGTIGYFLGKFAVERLPGFVGIGRCHTDRSTGFRRVLCHHKYADASGCQRRDFAAVHTDYAHHGKSAHGDHTGFVDRRNTANRQFALRRFIADDAAGSFGVEGIFNVNGYVLLTNGVNGGRIYHLGSEVAKFHRLGIGQVVDGIRRGNDAPVRQ